MPELDVTNSSSFSVASASYGQAQQEEFTLTLPDAATAGGRAFVMLSRGFGAPEQRLAAAKLVGINFVESLVARRYTSPYAAAEDADAALAQAKRDGELAPNAGADLLFLHLCEKHYQWLSIGNNLLLLRRNGVLTQLNLTAAQTRTSGVLAGLGAANAEPDDTKLEHELHDGDRFIVVSEVVLPIYDQLPLLLDKAEQQKAGTAATCSFIMQAMASLMPQEQRGISIAVADVHLAGGQKPAFSPLDQYSIDAVSETGDRSSQQDSVFTAQEAHTALAIVADGAGGHAGGKAASECVCNTLAGFWKRSFCHGLRDDLMFAAVEEAIRQAHRQIIIQGGGDAAKCGKSTIVLAYVCGSKAVIAHVGDSRAYLRRAGEWKCLTKDDSLVQFLYASGQITEEEMEKHPDKNMLTQALGIPKEPKIHLQALDLADGDDLLLCCDGMWNQLPKEDWDENNWSGDDRTAILKAQVNKAIQAAGGESDNVSAVWLSYRHKTPEAEPKDHTRTVLLIAAAVTAAVLLAAAICCCIMFL